MSRESNATRSKSVEFLMRLMDGRVREMTSKATKRGIERAQEGIDATRLQLRNASRESSESIRSVILYSRSAIPPTGSRQASHEVQFDALRAFAQERGWRVAGEFSDTGPSSSPASRDGLRRAVESLVQLGAEAMVVTSVTRITRQLRLMLHFQSELNSKGKLLVTLDDEVDVAPKE